MKTHIRILTLAAALCVSLALITSAPTMGYFFSHHSPVWLWAARGALKAKTANKQPLSSQGRW